MLRISVILLSLTIGAACVPTQVTYYLPTNETDAWETRHCGYPEGGYVGEFRESTGVFVTVQSSDSGLFITLQFSLRPYSSVRLSTDVLTVSDNNNRRGEGSIFARSPKSLAGKTVTDTLTATEAPARFIGRDGEGVVETHFYDFTSAIEGTFLENIVLTIPPLFVDGVEYKLDPINMYRVRKSSVLTC